MGYMNSRKAKKTQYTPTSSDGSKGVRATMNNMGLDNSKIGWRDGKVTYGNNSFKPSYVKDGVSYAPVSDIQGFVNDIYKSEGKKPVRVTDYVPPAGLGSISYSQNGQVSVGGENIPVLYMDGDRAVADEKDLDEAYAKLLKRTGLQTAEDMYDGWSGAYKSKLNSAYNTMTGGKEWSYDPDSDPVYKAYSEMYRREGDRAYRDAAAQMASKRNNGGMTSAAQTLANQQLAYYLSKLADKIPELAENSYDRYKHEYQKKKDAYTLLSEQAEADWSKRENTQKLGRDDYARSIESEKDRTEAETKRLDALYSRTENERKSAEALKNSAWSNAQRRGYFTDEEAELLQIPKNGDGYYMTPNEIKIREELMYFNEATKPQLQYESDLNLNELYEKYRLQKSNDAAKAARQLANSKSLAAYKKSIK